MILKLLSLFFLFLFVSCDLAKTLVIKNSTEQNISLVFAKTDNDPLFMDTLSIHELESGHQYRNVYGFGVWSKSEKNNIKEIFRQSKLVIGNNTVETEGNISIKGGGLLGNGITIKIKKR